MELRVIINPKSKRTISHEVLSERLNGIKYSLAITSRSGEATELARNAARANIAKLVVAGGDGTINEAINGIQGSRTALGIIPMGGANDFATYLGIPKSIDGALKTVLKGTTRRIDLIKINDRCFTTVGGLGFGTEVALKVNTLKGSKKLGKLMYRLLGSNIYTAYALYEILFRSEFSGEFNLADNGYERYVRLWGLFVSNQPSLGKNFLINPGATNDDGWLDICLIKEPNSKFKQLTTLLGAMRGKHLDLPHVEAHKTRSFTINCEKRLRFFGDGELLSDNPPYRIEVIPKALNVLVPRVV